MAEPVTAEPERDPFWSYTDVFMFAGMMLPCFLIAFVIFPRLAGFNPVAHPWQLVPEQSVFYALLGGILAALFRLQYDRPLWRSLGWIAHRFSLAWTLIAGVLTAILVSMVGTLIKVPITENPMTKLLKDTGSVIPLAIFGITIGPLFEELVFRGFLQPLLARTLGVAGGILAANIPFGILHYWEYGKSWRHVVVISLAGAAFGLMRHVSGSTRASTFMHAAYNALFFVALFAAKAKTGETRDSHLNSRFNLLCPACPSSVPARPVAPLRPVRALSHLTIPRDFTPPPVPRASHTTVPTRLLTRRVPARLLATPSRRALSHHPFQRDFSPPRPSRRAPSHDRSHRTLPIPMLYSDSGKSTQLTPWL